jgi:hypothetical protein
VRSIDQFHEFIGQLAEIAPKFQWSLVWDGMIRATYQGENYCVLTAMYCEKSGKGRLPLDSYEEAGAYLGIRGDDFRKIVQSSDNRVVWAYYDSDLRAQILKAVGLSNTPTIP